MKVVVYYRSSYLNGDLGFKDRERKPPILDCNWDEKLSAYILEIDATRLVETVHSFEKQLNTCINLKTNDEDPEDPLCKYLHFEIMK